MSALFQQLRPTHPRVPVRHPNSQAPDMAPKYKLTYFNVRGLGEPIRYILHYGGIEFEDNRLAWENWSEHKSSMPFGKVPVLEVDGKTMHQSCAILRYLAKPLGLAGANDFEAYEIDAVCDTINDFKQQLRIYYLADEETKKNYDSIFKETIPFYMSKFDEMVKNNKGYFVGGKLSWVDFYFTGSLDTLAVRMKLDLLANYPNLKALKQKVENLKGIKEWIAKRPVTEF